MADFNAGSAVATYDLDITAFQRKIQQLKAEFTALNEAERKLSAGANSGRSSAGNAQNESLKQLSASTKKALADFERLERQYNAVRDSEIRAAAAARDYSRALSLVQNQIDSAVPGTKRYNDLLARQATLQNQAQRAAEQANRAQLQNNSITKEITQSLTTTISGMIGPAALATAGVTALISAFQGLGQAAKDSLVLRENERSLEAISGSYAAYAKNLEIARQQQRLFGGTLAENIEGISGLAITARQNNLELEKLIDLSQRLNVLSPEQGVGGARVALAEGLSGQINSLAMRFEIPKNALRELGDESLSTEQRLKALDDYLNKVGITSEVASGKVDATTRSYRELAAEWEQLRLSAGSGIADAFEPAAQGLSRLIGIVNNNPDAIAKLFGLLNGGVIDENTLRAAANEAARRATGDNILNAGTFGMQEWLWEIKIGGKEELERLRTELTNLELESSANGEAARRLTSEWFFAEQTAADLWRKIEELKNGVQEVGVASGESGDKVDESTEAMAEYALKTLAAKDEAEKQAKIMAIIAQTSSDVRNGFITQAEGAAILAQYLGEAAGQALELQIALDGVDNRTKDQKIADQAKAPLTSAERSMLARAEAEKKRLEQQKAYREAEKDYQQQLLKFAPIADQIKAKQKELANLGNNDPRRFQILLELERLKEQQQSKSLQAIKAQDKALKAQVKSQEELLRLERERVETALSLERARIEDRQKTRAEEEELRQARNALANAADDRIRAAAADRIAMIELQRKERQFEIAKLQNSEYSQADVQLAQQTQKLTEIAAQQQQQLAKDTAQQQQQSETPQNMSLVFLIDGEKVAEAVIPYVAGGMFEGVIGSDAAGGGAVQA